MLIFLGGFLGGSDGVVTAFIFSLVLNGVMYFFSDKLALSMSGAKPVRKLEDPKFYRLVEGLCRKMDLPVPTLYRIPSEQANAFATGRDPHHASVAVTAGIEELLNEQELEGVLAHELGHIKNRDILVATVVAVMASSISFVANMSLYGGRDEERSPGPLGLILILLVPLAASLIQLAIGRQREFGADETGAKTIGDGDPLASALIKIHDSVNKKPDGRINPAISSLYIANPLGRFGGGLIHLLSTHPPVEERVKRLKEI